MAQPYVGEIRMFAGNFAPSGWMFCDGQILAILQYDALFALIGTRYGGDGQTTFALPNMQSRIPIHQGTGSQGTTYTLAETGGVESVTLTIPQIPAHNHVILGSNSSGSGTSPSGSVFARNASTEGYSNDTSGGLSTLNAGVIGSIGGSQPHENMAPYLCVNFIISMFGIFPSET